MDDPAWVGQRTAFVQGARLLALGASPTEDPWNELWLGHTGLIGQIGRDSPRVRIYCEYSAEFGVPTSRDYYCGVRISAPIAQRVRLLVRRIASLLPVAREINSLLPDSAKKYRIALVVIVDDIGSVNAYRAFNGEGLVFLERSMMEGDAFKRGVHLDALGHEGAHAVFDYHLTHASAPAIKQAAGGKATFTLEKALALHAGDLFVLLKDTKEVPVPTALFDPANPPGLELNPTEPGRPAGLTMVRDVLWSGSGGHPEKDVDEFFASGFAGFRRKPSFLGQIFRYYRQADPKIEPLVPHLVGVWAAAVPGREARKGLVDAFLAGYRKAPQGDPTPKAAGRAPAVPAPESSRQLKQRKRAVEAVRAVEPTPTADPTYPGARRNFLLNPRTIHGFVDPRSIDCDGYQLPPPGSAVGPDWYQHLTPPDAG